MPSITRHYRKCLFSPHPCADCPVPSDKHTTAPNRYFVKVEYWTRTVFVLSILLMSTYIIIPRMGRMQAFSFSIWPTTWAYCRHLPVPWCVEKLGGPQSLRLNLMNCLPQGDRDAKWCSPAVTGVSSVHLQFQTHAGRWYIPTGWRDPTPVASMFLVLSKYEGQIVGTWLFFCMSRCWLGVSRGARAVIYGLIVQAQRKGKARDDFIWKKLHFSFSIAFQLSVFYNSIQTVDSISVFVHLDAKGIMLKVRMSTRKRLTETIATCQWLTSNLVPTKQEW